MLILLYCFVQLTNQIHLPALGNNYLMGFWFCKLISLIAFCVFQVTGYYTSSSVILWIKIWTRVQAVSFPRISVGKNAKQVNVRAWLWCGRELLVAWALLLVACGIAAPTSRLQSRSHAYLFCVLSHGFSRKRETARSLNLNYCMLSISINIQC